MTGQVLATAAVTWLVTLIFVEGFIFAGAREWVSRRSGEAITRAGHAHTAVLRGSGPVDPRIHLTEAAAEDRARALDQLQLLYRKAHRRATAWRKLDYFVRCHLCFGVWVAAFLTALPGQPRPFGPGVLGWVLAALLVKAVAHLILEVAALLRRTAA